MAGKKAVIASSDTRYNAFQAQKSSYGAVIPTLIGGTNRIAASILWYGGFKALAVTTETESGGKGGGVKQSNTAYSYSASVVMGICSGPIESVTAVIRDKSEFINGATTALAQAGLSLKTGTAGQSVWPYLTTNFPDEAIGYTEFAYAYAADYPLTSGANLQNHTFEVVSPIRVSGKHDANPKDLVVEFLTNPVTGVPGWTTALIGNLTDFGNYCLAANLLLSPLLDAQRQASAVLEELCDAANSAPFWSEGKLKIKPFGTEARTGNGVTWTPVLTPAYDLTNADFLAEDDEPPVTSYLKRSSDAYNSVQIEFLNRARQYNLETMPAFDQAMIEQFGERKENPVRNHFICDAEVARQAAELRKDRVCYIRETFEFRLPWQYARLEPMDYVTLTETRMGLDRKLVRIIDIDEDDGEFQVLAEEVLAGVADAPLYPSQGAGGYIANYDTPPGDVANPVLFTPPSTLTEGRLELWAAASGPGEYWGGCEVWVSLDDASYMRVGVAYGPARYGVTTTALPTHTSPDALNTLGVDVSTSGAELLPATQDEADAAVTLCYVDGELISYRDAVLTAPFEYDLDYMLRGLNGSGVSSHVSGSTFVRVDDAVIRYAFLPEQAGRPVYVKFRSFNVFGRAFQDLADLTPYEAMLNTPAAFPDPVANLVRTNPSTEADIILAWTPSARALRYKVFVYSPNGATFYRSSVVTSPAFTYLGSEQTTDGSINGCLIIVVASNDSGDAIANSFTRTKPGTGPGGPQPATITGVAAFSPDFNVFAMVSDASPDPLTTGYALYMSATSGFTPTGAPTNSSSTPYVDTYSPTGIRYGRMAAYNADWNGDPATLNFAAEQAAAVLDYIEDCPHPDTPVLMADGSEKRAGDLAEGDIVRTMHEADRRWIDACVMAVRPSRGELVRVVFSNGRDLIATANHRLGVAGGGFCHLHDLGPGTVIDGISATEIVSVEALGPGPVVSLTIGEAKTCITAGVLSHNIKPIQP